jgi:hypothetical protein
MKLDFQATSGHGVTPLDPQEVGFGVCPGQSCYAGGALGVPTSGLFSRLAGPGDAYWCASLTCIAHPCPAKIR